MPLDSGSHVFISYVRDDEEQVDRLCAVLEASGIPYWRDRTALAPGDAWKAKIREAIQQGSLLFLACFSDASRARDRSTMNEELTLAVEEFRKMPPGRTWLIPIRFDDGEVPAWDLGAGRMLGDLNYVNLFGDQYAVQTASLVATILRLVGEKPVSPATALAAVEQVVDADRAAVITRLTKEMLLDPSRRIELDDLISSEVRRLLTHVSKFDEAPVVRQDDAVRVASALREAEALWRATEPFLRSLNVAARWATPDALRPWVEGLRAMVAAAGKDPGRGTLEGELRYLPVVGAVMTATLTCVSAEKWANLRELVETQSVRDPYWESQRVPLLEAVSPWTPFSNNESVAQVFARSRKSDASIESLYEDARISRLPKYKSPTGEWLHDALRSVFAEQLVDDASYDENFDQAEVMVGLMAQDMLLQRYPGPDQDWRATTNWFGRATYRSAYSRSTPVNDLRTAIAAEAGQWGPVSQGLFGSSVSRADAAVDAYEKTFLEIRRSRH